MQKILLIEDAPDTQVIVKALLNQRYHLLLASSAEEGLRVARETEVDLILLDVVLPDGNGFLLFSQLRALATQQQVPIIFLTGKGEVTDRVAGFSMGADDYVVKPFEPLEFRARIEAKLQARVGLLEKTAVVRQGRLQLDRSRFKAFREEAPGQLRDLDLTPHEFRLLMHLSLHVDQVLSRDQLMTAVWGENVHVLERTIDRHVSSLRKKLDAKEEQIESVHGIGYRFSVTGNAGRSKVA